LPAFLGTVFVNATDMGVLREKAAGPHRTPAFDFNDIIFDANQPSLDGILGQFAFAQGIEVAGVDEALFHQPAILKVQGRSAFAAADTASATAVRVPGRIHDQPRLAKGGKSSHASRGACV
jgi:hypothetical protein